MKEVISLIRAYYFVIQQILNRYSLDKRNDKKILHNAFKQFYRDEYNVSYESLKDYTKQDLINLINQILIQFAVEYGVYLLQPNDPENAEEFSLSEYLAYKDWYMKNSNYNMIEGISELPEGFTLVESLEDLIRLKKGKKVAKPGNVELAYGEPVYLYCHRENLYYKKYLTTYTPIDKLKEYINLKITYANVDKIH